MKRDRFVAVTQFPTLREARFGKRCYWIYPDQPIEQVADRLTRSTVCYQNGIEGARVSYHGVVQGLRNRVIIRRAANAASGRTRCCEYNRRNHDERAANPHHCSRSRRSRRNIKTAYIEQLRRRPRRQDERRIGHVTIDYRTLVMKFDRRSGVREVRVNLVWKVDHTDIAIVAVTDLIVYGAFGGPFTHHRELAPPKAEFVNGAARLVVRDQLHIALGRSQRRRKREHGAVRRERHQEPHGLFRSHRDACKAIERFSGCRTAHQRILRGVEYCYLATVRGNHESYAERRHRLDPDAGGAAHHELLARLEMATGPTVFHHDRCL